MEQSLIVKFEGGMAERHRLPAYEAAQSSYGISRSLLIVMNYLDEGRVRRREFNPRGFQINIVAQREGSFDSIYELIFNVEMMTVLGGLGLGIGGNLLTDFIKTIFGRCLGKEGTESIEGLEARGKLNPGDLSALSDAIEPAMRAAHTIINHGAGNIILISGDKNVVTMDRSTKEYVWTSVPDDAVKTKLFSIASYNANTRSGRAFDYDLGKTVPFEIARDADRETFSIVLSSISSYALRRLGDDLRSAIALKYTSIVSADGKTKRISILRARREIQELNAD